MAEEEYLYYGYDEIYHKRHPSNSIIAMCDMPILTNGTSKEKIGKAPICHICFPEHGEPMEANEDDYQPLWVNWIIYGLPILLLLGFVLLIGWLIII